MAWMANLACGVAVAVCAAYVLGQAPPDYDLDWVTIGAPGNRHTIPSEVPGEPSLQVGGVDYEYRIMRSKLNVDQYYEFVQAYAPFWTGGLPNSSVLTGPYISGSLQGGSWQYTMSPHAANYPGWMHWEMAARYCNWLHNGKANQAWAFESGVYDTSTFVWGPNWSAQLEPSPGARYWIPSVHELMKAGYYDPNRYGPGEGGYWRYPNGTNSPLYMELPANGGETIGDLLWQTPPGPDGWDLRQYPDTQSPWGLIDISATVPDYSSTVMHHATGSVFTLGSLAGSSLYYLYDPIDTSEPGGLWGSWIGGLRIASPVPAPSFATLAGCTALWLISRRRRG